jgi:hypothetical protein
MKPKLYFVFYPKMGRGFWRVSPMPHRSLRTLALWTFAHQIARDANRILEQEGKARP